MKSATFLILSGLFFVIPPAKSGYCYFEICELVSDVLQSVVKRGDDTHAFCKLLPSLTRWHIADIMQIGRQMYIVSCPARGRELKLIS